jgi:hypothetical protein
MHWLADRRETPHGLPDFPQSAGRIAAVAVENPPIPAKRHWHTPCTVRSMPRILAAFVMVALAVSAIPSAAIAPVCHRCCDEVRLDATDGHTPPCCRVSPNAPRPVARQVNGRATATPAVLTMRPMAVAPGSGVLLAARGIVITSRQRLPAAVLRI